MSLADATYATATDGAAKAGRRVKASEVRPVDLVICGSVAVDGEGARIGKAGFLRSGVAS